MDKQMKQIAWKAWVDHYDERSNAVGVYASCEAVLAEHKRRESAAQEPQMEQTTPAEDVVKMWHAYNDAKGSCIDCMTAALAVAREGWVPENELDLARVHVRNANVAARSWQEEAQKLEQQLAGTVTLDAVEKALNAHWLAAIDCNHEKKTDQALCFCGWRGEAFRNVGGAVSSFADHVRARLTQQEPTEQQKIEAILIKFRGRIGVEKCAAEILAAIKGGK